MCLIKWGGVTDNLAKCRNSEKKATPQYKLLFLCCVSAFIIFSTFLCLLIFNGYAPFGNRTLAAYDINISQLDIYGYLYDVIHGKNTFGYSLSMGLGGDTFNVVSYSMSSPLNIIFAIARKDQYLACFNIVALLKLTIIAAVIAWYLSKRFYGQLNTIFTILLSVSYTYCQYSIAGIVNIFWLDGVMLLPIILYGVYKLITENNCGFMIAGVALSILFNWYTGAINCIFCIFWFIFEYFLNWADSTIRIRIKSFFQKTAIAVYAGITGVLISGIFLIPTFNAIKQGNRGSLNLEALNRHFIGNPLTVISNSTIGNMHFYPDKVCLFTGALGLLGILLLFKSREVERKIKIVISLFLLFVILSFYWEPFFLLFSMLKNATSFWSRYGYIGNFAIIFISAYCFSMVKKIDKGSLIITAIVYDLLFIALCDLSTAYISYEDKLTAAFILVIAICLEAYFCFNKDDKLRKFAITALCITSVTEMTMNVNFLIDDYGLNIGDSYKTYVDSQEEQIQELKDYDNSDYRISQSSTRNANNGDMRYGTANYNEPLAYNYWGISSYTNRPNDKQRAFLHAMGYKSNGENMYIVNTSILAADSLLGVKYFLSPYQVNGYKIIDNISEANGKYVYENPFALPMVFTYKGEGNNIPYNENNANPFTYQNDVYGTLLGHETKIYNAIDYSITNEKTNSVEYELTVPSEECVLYGFIPTDDTNPTSIYINDEFSTIYSQWLAPRVFIIPEKNSGEKVSVRIESNENMDGVLYTSPQFYYLSLNTLKEATDELKQGSIEDYDITNKGAVINVDAYEGQKIMTSIPYDPGWVVKDNGTVIQPNQFENCFLSFNLSKGKHSIVISYRSNAVERGALASLAGVLSVICYVFVKKKCNRKLPFRR